ncbi:MAG: ATP-binding protein [Gammaproteobacteria bacterium]|nr:ATP-binding protein [Gammaproteobacteria bacterium]
MKIFYNRDLELRLLRATSDKISQTKGRLTMLVGRRRVGKTALLLQSFKTTGFLYLFVTKTTESDLAEQFFLQIKEQLDIKVFGSPSTLHDVFDILLDYTKTHPLTVVIDEFQDINIVNPSFFSQLQKLWDLNKDSSMMHLVCCGSIYSMMTKLFQDAGEPLFGRADRRVHLKPLKPSYIKEIMLDNDLYNPADYLLWFCFSGGIPKYTEWLVDAGDKTWQRLISEHSLVAEEGRYRLFEDFGSEHPLYFSILSAIASGKTSRGEIEWHLDGTSVGVALENLEQTYEVVTRSMPITAKEKSRGYRYQIVDPFLSFWFRFIYKNRSAIEIGNFAYVRSIIERDFSVYSDRSLELLCKEILAESGQFNQIGSYWERGNANEIDIIAINDLDKRIVIGEVKRQSKRYSETILIEKSVPMLQKLKKHGYSVEYHYFSLDFLDSLFEKFPAITP